MRATRTGWVPRPDRARVSAHRHLTSAPCAALLALLCAALAAPALAEAPSGWAELQRLVGSWRADSGSGGAPGTALRGAETWRAELDGRVLVRRDTSEYAATARHPAFRHAGLTVFAPAPAGGLEARSFDNEGHVIDYDVAAADTAIVLTSRPVAGAPRFRLAYRPAGEAWDVTFEIAPPGAPGAFRRYVAGRMHRAP